MNTKSLNTDLIEAIKESLPEKANLPNVLMDILKIGKEAVYRRLRSEVPFTFAEALLISKAQGLSLDHLTSLPVNKRASFNMYLMEHEAPLEAYCHSMNSFIENCSALKDDPSTEWYTASNTIPHAFYMDHDHLLRFMLFKRIYQKGGLVKYYGELKVPGDIRRMQSRFIEVTKSLAYSCFIWDEMMFLSLVNDLRYFYDINAITDQEKALLKEDFLSLIDILENLAAKGRHGDGREVNFYISNINFEATYSYLCTHAYRFSFVRLYEINSIYTADWNVFEYQRDWIQSLKKYSTLISVSGERQRIQFFERQRSFVNKL
ncbi:MAG: hypothetical protein LBS88_06295 [Tannerellaceae bacterium]|jgi:hypothetical protein|nr:hypothetical protein [Tannerellaceae bacterium]